MQAQRLRTPPAWSFQDAKSEEQRILPLCYQAPMLGAGCGLLKTAKAASAHDVQGAVHHGSLCAPANATSPACPSRPHTPRLYSPHPSGARNAPRGTPERRAEGRAREHDAGWRQGRRTRGAIAVGPRGACVCTCGGGGGICSRVRPLGKHRAIGERAFWLPAPGARRRAVRRGVCVCGEGGCCTCGAGRGPAHGSALRSPPWARWAPLS